MKQVLIILSILILATGSFASQARIESMGKRPAFFLDEMTMFDNPANATFYSNALMGELGFYEQKALGPNNVGFNKDPFEPWFGGLFKYNLSDNGLRNPQITIGGFFGREHYQFTRLIPKAVRLNTEKNPILIPQTITNFDAFLAGTMIDGSAVGAHVYVGIQDGKQDNNSIASNAHVSILSMDYGANFLVTNRSSVEFSFGIARIQYGPSRKTFLDPGLFSHYYLGRFFTDVDAINGQWILGGKMEFWSVPGREEQFYDVNTGVNMIIPRGMIWIGLDGVHRKERLNEGWEKYIDEKGNATGEYIYVEPGKDPREDRRSYVGGVISFGIERNIWSNLITVRAGGQKSFLYNKCTDVTGNKTICDIKNGREANYFSTNPFGDGSLDDHLGVGFGLNIADKLNIDVAVSEDVFFRNPFKGSGNLVSRISAKYSF